MEKLPSLQEDHEGEPQSPSHAGLFSCWACLIRRVFPWRRLRRRASERWHMLRSVSRSRRPKPGNFRYDPLSYSQNFEDNAWDKDDDPTAYRGFSSRFVVTTPENPPGSGDVRSMMIRISYVCYPRYGSFSGHGGADFRWVRLPGEVVTGLGRP